MKTVGDVVISDIETLKTYTTYDIPEGNEETIKEVETKSLAEDKQKSVIIKISNIMAKRTIDIIGAIIGIIILIPLTIIITIINAFNKENGPVFYVQERIRKRW